MAIDADQGDIRVAYRKKALLLHPDVSNAPNAEAQFLELSDAYGKTYGSVRGMGAGLGILEFINSRVQKFQGLGVLGFWTFKT